MLTEVFNVTFELRAFVVMKFRVRAHRSATLVLNVIPTNPNATLPKSSSSSLPDHWRQVPLSIQFKKRLTLSLRALCRNLCRNLYTSGLQRIWNGWWQRTWSRTLPVAFATYATEGVVASEHVPRTMQARGRTAGFLDSWWLLETPLSKYLRYP